MMYRVWAKSIGYCYLDVEADSQEEAEQIARDTDGGDFIEDSGDWEYLFDETEEIKSTDIVSIEKED